MILKEQEPDNAPVTTGSLLRRQAGRLKRSRDLQRNGILALASTAMAAIVGLIAAPLLARFLPVEEYGALSYVGSVVALVMAISVPGVANAISFSVARGYEGAFRIGSKYRLRRYLLTSLLFVPLIGWYLFVKPNPQLAVLLLVAGLAFPWVYGLDTSEQFLVGRSDFGALFWRRLLVTVLVPFSGVAAAWLFASGLAVLSVRSIVTAILTFALYFLLLRTVRNEDLDPEFWPKANAFNRVSVLGAVSGVTDNLVLGATGDLAALAGYSLALTVTSPLDVLSKSMIKLVFGRVQRPLDAADRRLLTVLSLLVILVGVPVILAAWFLVAPFFVRLFPKYPETIRYIPVLLLVFVFGLANSVPLSYGLFHRYRIWLSYNTWRNASRIPITAGAVLAAGVWGALGVRLAYAVLDYVVFVVAMWRDNKSLPDPTTTPTANG
ncbi:MAG TPA: hypothetical protein VL334_02365 [Anaerolineae bacterium]|nr:hypothetical protein [Anaerolineae bacterium]